jgi:ribonuclease HI
LSEFDIDFRPRTAIKAQVLADFLSEGQRPTAEPIRSTPWTIQVDGSSLGSMGGVGVYARAPDGIESDYAIKLDFPVTNNEAEYEAVIAGIRVAKENEAREVIILTDSQLVVSQFDGTFETREGSLMKYLDKVKDLSKQFSSFILQQVPREENQ